MGKSSNKNTIRNCRCPHHRRPRGISRRSEWDKWGKYTAVHPASRHKMKELLIEGHKPLPHQRFEVDKIEHTLQAGSLFVASPCSRAVLVVHRRDFQPNPTTRDVEGLNLLLSCAVRLRVTDSVGEITNFSFQCKPWNNHLSEAAAWRTRLRD